MKPAIWILLATVLMLILIRFVIIGAFHLNFSG